jgi:hypothetical protein
LIGGTVAALLIVLAAYFFLVRQNTVQARVLVPRLVATIGEGDDAIGVSAMGALVRWLPLPDDPSLPRLPLDEAPRGGRVGGPVLEQVQVRAAAPDALRPYVAGSDFGESGVEVELTTGINLYFGDATQAARKWRAAAAVLANPEITALDYVNLIAPSRPSWDGSEHELPTLP